tara:strand:+ start:556 stop:840 length:285 start_codon:yes stop_codon:yes gene_type:complete
LGKSKRNPSVLALELSIRYYDLTIQGSKRFVFEFRKNGYFVGWFTFSSDCSSFIVLEIAWQTSATPIDLIMNTPKGVVSCLGFDLAEKPIFSWV